LRAVNASITWPRRSCGRGQPRENSKRRERRRRERRERRESRDRCHRQGFPAATTAVASPAAAATAATTAAAAAAAAALQLPLPLLLPLPQKLPLPLPLPLPLLLPLPLQLVQMHPPQRRYAADTDTEGTPKTRMKCGNTRLLGTKTKGLGFGRNEPPRLH